MTLARRMFAVALLALAAAGCKQSLGDRCQVSDDCGDGLFCQIPSNTTLAEGGTCQLIGTALPDMAAMAGDMAMNPPDMTGDLVSVGDMSMADAADAAPPDMTELPDLSGDGAD